MICHGLCSSVHVQLVLFIRFGVPVEQEVLLRHTWGSSYCAGLLVEFYFENPLCFKP